MELRSTDNQSFKVRSLSGLFLTRERRPAPRVHQSWRGVREAEGTALEMRQVAKHSFVGSTPTLAAIFQMRKHCIKSGEVAEWSKAPNLKSGEWPENRFESSNLSLAARFRRKSGPVQFQSSCWRWLCSVLLSLLQPTAFLVPLAPSQPPSTGSSRRRGPT